MVLLAGCMLGIPLELNFATKIKSEEDKEESPPPQQEMPLPPRVNTKASGAAQGGARKVNVAGGRNGRQALRRKDSKTQDNMNDMGIEDEEVDQQNQVREASQQTPFPFKIECPLSFPSFQLGPEECLRAVERCRTERRLPFKDA